MFTDENPLFSPLSLCGSRTGSHLHAGPFDIRLIGGRTRVIDDQRVAVVGEGRGRQAERKGRHLAPRVLHGVFVLGLEGQLGLVNHDLRIARPRPAAVATGAHLDLRRAAAVDVDHAERAVGKRDRRCRLAGDACVPNGRPRATGIG